MDTYRYILVINVEKKFVLSELISISSRSGFEILNSRSFHIEQKSFFVSENANQYLINYIKDLQASWKWVFFSDYGNDEILQVRGYESIGIGLDKIVLVVDDGLSVDKIRDRIPSIAILVKNSLYHKKLARRLNAKLGYTNILEIDISYDEIGVCLNSIKSSKEYLGIEDIEVLEFQSSIDYSSVVDISTVKKYEPILFYNPEDSYSINEVYNCFILGADTFSDDSIINNIYYSVILKTLFDSISDIKQRFASMSRVSYNKSLVWVSYLKMPRSLLIPYIIMLIDTLEIEKFVDIMFSEGSSDKSRVVIDDGDNIISLMSKYSVYRVYNLGNYNEYVENDILGYLVLEDRFGDTARVYLKNKLDNIVSIDDKVEKVSLIRRDGELPEVIYSKTKDKRVVDYIIMDGRNKPSIYGPSWRENIAKMSEWRDVSLF